MAAWTNCENMAHAFSSAASGAAGAGVPGTSCSGGATAGNENSAWGGAIGNGECAGRKDCRTTCGAPPACRCGAALRPCIGDCEESHTEAVRLSGGESEPRARAHDMASPGEQVSLTAAACRSALAGLAGKGIHAGPRVAVPTTPLMIFSANASVSCVPRLRRAAFPAASSAPSCLQHTKRHSRAEATCRAQL